MTDLPLRVVAGDPTPEELAAVIAVLALRSIDDSGHRPRREPSEWAAPRHRMRPVVRRRPEGWRRSGLPH